MQLPADDNYSRGFPSSTFQWIGLALLLATIFIMCIHKNTFHWVFRFGIFTFVTFTVCCSFYFHVLSTLLFARWFLLSWTSYYRHWVGVYQTRFNVSGSTITQTQEMLYSNNECVRLWVHIFWCRCCRQSRRIYGNIAWLSENIFS